MKEVTGNLWTFHAQYLPIVITTNGDVRRDGACVMGRGVARQAANRYPKLPYSIGDKIKHYGNHAFSFACSESQIIFTFPVKHHWSELADIKLITRSCDELILQLSYWRFTEIYMPRPGCGNGGLTWDVVRPIIAEKLDDRFTICEINP